MQKGNSTLELILFLPIALFFLFVVIDAGLSLTQRAAISDAFRSGVASLPAHAKLEKDNSELVKKVADELSVNIAKVFSSYTSGEFEVITRLYSLPIDTKTGMKGAAFPTLVVQYNLGAITEPHLLKSFDSPDQYLQETIAKDTIAQGSGVSSYAEPQGIVNNTMDNSMSGIRYKDTSWLLYAEVKAVPSGINSSYLRAALGGLYSVQLQQVEKLRDY